VSVFFGVAYYPEHWPEERWEIDAQLMQAAGINGVRMGEFAWSKIEPQEGKYHFEWLDQAIRLLSRYGIQTMMCTCSRTPPPWVFHKYPDIRNTRADGRQSNYGYRYTVCHNNPNFIELSQRIDRAVVEHFAGNPDVIAWHIDNEIGSGNTCYCHHCHQKFIAHLREKYGSIENLNACWGMHFWSFAFSDFEEVPLPTGVPFASPSLALEYARFQSRVNGEFAMRRYQLMKQLHPSAWVTTNFQTTNATHTDLYELGRATDVYGTNFYPLYAPEFALDYCRGDRGKLMILEQESGQPHWSAAVKPGWLRLWTYRSIAHGACGINYFQWRTCRWGQEEYWHGVLPHSGRPGRRYQEIQQTGEELKQLANLIDPTRPEALAAIVMSYPSRWALQAVSSSEVLPPVFSLDAMNVHEEAKAYHTALMDLNITTDALDPHMDLSRYRLVIAPRLYCVDARVAENLLNFVETGGVLCLTPRSGVVDEYNVIHNRPAPGFFCQAAGVEVDEYGGLETPLSIKAIQTGLEGVTEGVTWVDEIIPTSAQVLATFDQGWLKGKPAITVHAYGKGKVVYVGTLVRGTSLQALLAWLCQEAGVDAVLPTPPGVRAYERRSATHRLVFLLNFSEGEQVLHLAEPWEDCFTGKQVIQVELKPAGVAVIRRSR
jgi:beta-galactosidase